MAFRETSRNGEILGNKVTATPVSVAELAALEESKNESPAAVMRAMCDIVSAHVKDDEGNAIDAKRVSPQALRALFDFAIGTEGLKPADFSGPRE